MEGATPDTQAVVIELPSAGVLGDDLVVAVVEEQTAVGSDEDARHT
jgi:hypothetical protein